MKLKKPRKMLPGETIMEGDEFRYPTDGPSWFDAVAFLGDTVKGVVPRIQFRTYRPLPKKKKVKKVYTFEAEGPYWRSGFRIYRNGACIASSHAKAYAKLICDALNGK